MIFAAILVNLALADKLLHAQIYLRHGIRTQFFGRWNPSQLSEEELGQLTTGGIYQMYQLGKALKAEYIDQLGLVKNHLSEIYIRSTDLDRSLMSAHVLSYSMFEKQEEAAQFSSKKKDLLEFQNVEQTSFLASNVSLPGGYWPVPYHTVASSKDNLLLGWDPAPCPVIALLNNQNQRSREIKQTNVDWLPFFQQMRKKGLQMNNVVDGGELADDIFSSIGMAEKIPNLTPEEIQALDYLRSIYYQITDFNHYNQVRFQATPFIRSLLSYIENRDTAKMIIFMSHDNNIFQILNFMNLTDWNCVNEHALNTLPFFYRKNPDYQKLCQITNYPKFGSQAIFEVWANNERDIYKYEQLYVKFKFNGKYYPICDNQIKCPLYYFVNLMQALQFQDYEQKCIIQATNHDTEKSKVMMFTIMLFMFSFLFLIIGLNYTRQILLEAAGSSYQDLDPRIMEPLDSRKQIEMKDYQEEQKNSQEQA